MAQNFTVWQRLTRVFGPDSTLGQQPPVYKFDKKELLKTTDKQEFEKEKLQAQQTYYLGQQWSKIENNLYTQAVYYEPTRLASYYDYESMEYTPEELPFNVYGDLNSAIEQIEKWDPLVVYPELKKIISNYDNIKIVDFGCGGGWLVNSFSYHHRNKIKIVGVDFNTVAN